MVMKATPASALVVTEAEVLLQVLVVSLYASALIGDASEFVDAADQRAQLLLHLCQCRH